MLKIIFNRNTIVIQNIKYMLKQFFLPCYGRIFILYNTGDIFISISVIPISLYKLSEFCGGDAISI